VCTRPHGADGIAVADEGPGTSLELMNMVEEHLSENDMRHGLPASDGDMRQIDPAWMALVGEVRDAMQRPLSVDSEAAQVLAWRWMRLVVRTTGNEPALAGKLIDMQLAERRAQGSVGIDPAMTKWIDEAFVHARCTLFAKHLSPEQAEEVCRRQLVNIAHQQAWPALVAELRALKEADADAGSPEVQDIVRRWQQLFRESYSGDDPVLAGRVREAFMHEPDLRLGVGMDEALLTYFHQAQVAAHRMPLANAGPKPSAMMVAVQRAAHQLIDSPLVLDDPLALTILGPTDAQALRSDLDRSRQPMAQGLRSSVVVRSRFAEDEWAAAIARGVRQYVVLGAGLDTSAYRHADAPGRMFEVDLPSTQAWKRARLQEVGIEPPPSLSYVPVDFETISLAQGLAGAGFDPAKPAFFSWLGVSMYLEEASVVETLRFIAGCAPGSAVVFDYIVPFSTLPLMMRIAMEQLAVRLAANGEPWKAHFEPAALSATLSSLGFSACRSWAPEELNARYLANRSDGLHMGTGPARLMHASV
jgi:methyltransferase (TIGR00027 family)